MQNIQNRSRFNESSQVAKFHFILKWNKNINKKKISFQLTPFFFLFVSFSFKTKVIWESLGFDENKQKRLAATFFVSSPGYFHNKH